MTPTFTRSGPHNQKNIELTKETERMGGNPYRAKALEAMKKRKKTRKV